MVGGAATFRFGNNLGFTELLQFDGTGLPMNEAPPIPDFPVHVGHSAITRLFDLSHPGGYREDDPEHEHEELQEY